jgi:hypothetical protein
MLVCLLAPNERLVCLDRSRQRAVERLGHRGMPQTVKHEPCRLLRDLDVLRELGAGDTLLVGGNQPDRHKPLPQRDFAVFEDRPDLDRETLAAIAALVRLGVGEVIDLRRTAVRTERPTLPTDSCEVRDGRRFVGDRVHQFKEAIEVGHIACSI